MKKPGQLTKTSAGSRSRQDRAGGGGRGLVVSSEVDG